MEIDTYTRDKKADIGDFKLPKGLLYSRSLRGGSAIITVVGTTKGVLHDNIDVTVIVQTQFWYHNSI